MSLHTLTVHELSELLHKKEISSTELTRNCLDRIDKQENIIKAFITVAEEEALSQAEAVDKRRAGGETLSPLAGIPAAVSDNICTAGIKTTCASKILYNYIPPVDSTVVARMKKAGAIIIGKTNMDEFGMGSTTEYSAFHTTRNPVNHEALPGGSCGGSAAAVAAGEAVFSLGSDTGGDIRQPASFCGVTGIKPTYGYVSRAGLISYASSLDQIGPFTRDVTDLAFVLNAICGYDGGDSTSSQAEVPDFLKCLTEDVKGLKIGLPKEYFTTEVDSPLSAAVRNAARRLESMGALVEEISLPHTGYAAAAHYIISSGEASSNLARYDGVRHGLRVEADDILTMFKKTRREGFGREVRGRIMLGTHVLSLAQYHTFYTKALKIRTLIRQDFDNILSRYDCLLTPVSPVTALRLEERTDNPLAVYSSHNLTAAVNLAGLPAMSLPYGQVEGMPVGIQLIAGHFAEGILLRVGYALEQSEIGGSR